jgi:uncharacterized protein YegP (UPF0339 family)
LQRFSNLFIFYKTKHNCMAQFDNYLPCEQYANAPGSSKYPGFNAWYDEAANAWYFALTTDKGRVVLRSEAYTTESARDNGIESVNRNRDIRERYSLEEVDGKWYAILKAGNHQEIARSCAYDSDTDAVKGVDMCHSEFKDVLRSEIVENYQPCEFYSGQPGSEKYPGFTTWKDEESGEFYFAMVDGKGNVLLRSEAYTNEPARNNGIESVNRNRDIRERYSIVEEDGKWYVILKAGNHQEIARSCGYDSDSDANNGVSRCFTDYQDVAMRTAAVVENYQPCEFYGGHTASEKYPGFTTWKDEESGEFYFAMVDAKGNVLLRSEAYTTESARNNGIESVNRNRDNEARYSTIQDEADGLWYTILKAGNHQEIARSCGNADQAAALALVARTNSAFKDQAPSGRSEDYLPCEAYSNHTASEKHPGFTTFSLDGQHYFALVDGHGGTILRSEGYSSIASRDNGIESVLRNRDMQERYSIVQDEADGLWYVSLKAGNRQEIARSCGLADRAAAADHLLHCYSKKALEDIAMGKGEIIEDYLPCKAYEGHPASSFEGFTTFQDKTTGLHYFAMIDDDGNVALKSEGYKDPVRRDSGIESVIRNRGIKDHWKEIEDEHGHYMSLRAVNHQEIARSCHKDKASMLAWFAPFLAAHAAWGKDAEPEEVPVADVVTPPVTPPPPKVVESTKTTPPPVTAYTGADEAAAAAGGSDWWKWLLGLLLLGLLAWFLMRGCDNKVEPPKPPTVAVPPPVAPVPADTVKTVAPPPPPPAAACNCSGNKDALFNLPDEVTAKKLSRLGTNPEFGDSHGLTPAAFLEKLQQRARLNKNDARFLDRVYKGMGYKGFSEAKADQFSEVVLPAGTAGNLGYGKQHGTGYYTLPDNDRDRQAFRIKSANGCDMHFMKTCGNHFFTCSK